MSLVGTLPLDDQPAPPVTSRPPGIVAARVVLALAAIILILGQGSRMASPPGMSHDGQNLGVFALGSRGLRTEGPVDSHLGADLAHDMGTYANHPPLLYWSIAATESVFGEVPWATRLPTILAALATIPLLFSILRRGGIQPLPAAAGVAVAVGSPLFSIYGWMPDTPMLALPLALATMLVWQRARQTKRHIALGVLTCLTCLAGWQGVVMCLVLIACAGHDAWKFGRWPTFIMMATVTATTVAAVLAWSYWSYGSFDRLLQSAGQRVGEQDAPGLGEVIRTQSNFLIENWRLPVLLGAPIGALLAWRNPRTRRLLLVLTFIVAAYSAVFWQAATVHRYWTLWAVAPVALCIAALFQALIDRPGPIHRNPIVVAVLALVLTTASVLNISAAEEEFDLGLSTRPAVDMALAEGQTVSYTVGMVDPRWTAYSTHRHVERLDREGLAELATVHPEWRVLFNCLLRRLDEGPPPCTQLDDPTAVWSEPLVATRADAAAAAFETP